MSDYPTLKEYVMKDIELLEQDYELTVQQEIYELVEKVLDVLPAFDFENGKPFYPSDTRMVTWVNCDPNMSYGLNLELRWQYPSITNGHFIIDFETQDKPLSYHVYIAEKHYHKSGKGTFESLCSELAHEFHKFCMDF